MSSADSSLRFELIVGVVFQSEILQNVKMVFCGQKHICKILHPSLGFEIDVH